MDIHDEYRAASVAYLRAKANQLDAQPGTMPALNAQLLRLRAAVLAAQPIHASKRTGLFAAIGTAVMRGWRKSSLGVLFRRRRQATHNALWIALEARCRAEADAVTEKASSAPKQGAAL